MEYTVKVLEDRTEIRLNGKLNNIGDKPAIEYNNGDKRWYRNGVPDRDDDPIHGHMPATVLADGTKIWFRKGVTHRDDDLPAIEYKDGGKEWYHEGSFHRVNGPAIIHADGTKKWYKNGQRHRANAPDGTPMPAVERADGTNEYWVNGYRIIDMRATPQTDVVANNETSICIADIEKFRSLLQSLLNMTQSFLQ